MKVLLTEKTIGRHLLTVDATDGRRAMTRDFCVLHDNFCCRRPVDPTMTSRATVTRVFCEGGGGVSDVHSQEY